MASEYLITLADIGQIPSLFKGAFLKGRAEQRIAFVGRSNVGKSSLINALLEQKIARVSQTPGKTKAIHFFHWDTLDKIVVDLPGYGFAKVAHAEKKAWSILMDAYFAADRNLQGVLLLFDGRHGPTDQDLEALTYFSSKGIPLQIVLTKFDQLKNQSERVKRKREVLERLGEFDLQEADLIWVSIKDKLSIKRLRERLV
jgi:GTP-binding protein